MAGNPLAEFDRTGEHVDGTTFEQILEMDDDEDDREFSKGIVFGFFEQATSTFQKMDEALQAKDLKSLSGLGHFLKGSSATLGLVKVRDSCERIQHLGNRQEDANPPDRWHEDQWYLERLRSVISQVKGEYQNAERVLKSFYGTT